MYTKKELKENIEILKEAYKRAAESGGVTSYSINSGQSSTNVSQASLSSIRAELEYFTSLLDETEQFESGQNCISLQGIGYL